MAWAYLVLAGVFECVWSTTMKLSDGFSHIGWTLATIAGMVLSFGLLALSLKHLDLSLAYPIWTGIGAIGAILMGVLLFHDQIAGWTWFFIALLLVGIIGIKMTT